MTSLLVVPKLSRGGEVQFFYLQKAQPQGYRKQLHERIIRSEIGFCKFYDDDFDDMSENNFMLCESTNLRMTIWKRLKEKLLAAKNREDKVLHSVLKIYSTLNSNFKSCCYSKMFKNKLFQFSGYKYVKPYLKQIGYDNEKAERLANILS